MNKYLIRVSGEIALKGSRRRLLERILEDNIRSILSERDRVERIDGGRFVVESYSEISETLARIFGVHEVLKVEEIFFKDLNDLSEFVKEKYCEKISERTFAVRARRVGSHTFTSIDVAKVVGDKLRECNGRVDLENPEIEIYIEIRGEKAYVTDNSRRVRGYGGLPLGSSERVLVLFSGGFDSTVATWLLMRKGSPTDLLYINMGSINAMRSALEVAEELLRRWSINHRARVYVVDFGEIVKEIREKINPRYWQISLRRSMYLIARDIALRQGYTAIATGESIWEANTQTISNITICSKGIDFTIIRPVIGLSKEDIINLSREIGLYSKCERVIETCWLGSYAPVKVDEERFLREFNKLDQGIFRRAAERIVEINIYEDWRAAIERLFEREIEIERIPEDAIVVDVTGRNVGREISGFRIQDLREIYRHRDKPIVLVCEKGEISYTLARELRREGYNVFSLRGGLRNLLRQ